MAEEADTVDRSPPLAEAEGCGGGCDEDDGGGGGSEAIRETRAGGLDEEEEEEEARAVKNWNREVEEASDGTNDLHSTRLPLFIFLFALFPGKSCSPKCER